MKMKEKYLKIVGDCNARSANLPQIPQVKTLITPHPSDGKNPGTWEPGSRLACFSQPILGFRSRFSGSHSRFSGSHSRFSGSHSRFSGLKSQVPRRRLGFFPSLPVAIVIQIINITDYRLTKIYHILIRTIFSRDN